MVDVSKRAINATYAFVVPDLWKKHTQYTTSNILIDGVNGYRDTNSKRQKEASDRLDQVKNGYGELMFSGLCTDHSVMKLLADIFWRLASESSTKYHPFLSCVR